jgi:VanZ family protein
MSRQAPRSSLAPLILLWAGIALAMAILVVWGAIQDHDPLAKYVAADKVRHILAFGAIGLCAGLMPTAASRTITLGAVLTFAMLVELVQIPIPYRSASVADMFASMVGAFAGFGLGAAAANVLELVRGRFSELSRPSLQRS